MKLDFLNGVGGLFQLAGGGGIERRALRFREQPKHFGELTVSLGLKVGGAGLAAAVGLGKIASGFIERGDAIKKASDRIGDSAENVSLLGYAAEMSGTNLEGLENGLRKMQKAIVAKNTT